jgi:O-antigen/teichoic acid export membrane protein
VTGSTTRIARHTLAYATGSVVGGVTRAALLPVIARRLSTDEFGVLALLLAATNLLHVVFELGLVTALIRYHHDTEEPAEPVRLRSTLFLALPAFDVMLAAPFLLGRDLVSRALFGTPDHGLLVVIAVGAAFFGAQLQLFLGHLRAHDRSRSFALILGAKGIVSFVATLILVFGFEMGVTGFLLGNLAGPALMAAIFVPRHLARSGLDLTGAGSRLRRVLRFGLPLVPSALGLWALSYLDTYLLRLLADLSSVGVYQFGSELCLPIALLVTSFWLAWPSFAFARARSDGGPEELARVFRHAIVVVVGGALLIAVFRREILAVVGTEAYDTSERIVPLLALATCLYAVSQLFGTGLQVAGDTRRLPLLVLLAAVVNTALNVLMIPLWREVGAAVATVVTNAVLSGLVLRESNRQFRIPFELGKLARLVGVAAGLVVAADALGALPFAPRLVLRGALVLVFPVLLVSGRVLSGEELRRLPGVVRELGRRSDA